MDQLSGKCSSRYESEHGLQQACPQSPLSNLGAAPIAEAQQAAELLILSDQTEAQPGTQLVVFTSECNPRTSSESVSPDELRCSPEHQTHVGRVAVAACAPAYGAAWARQGEDVPFVPLDLSDEGPSGPGLVVTMPNPQSNPAASASAVAMGTGVEEKLSTMALPIEDVADSVGQTGGNLKQCGQGEPRTAEARLCLSPVRASSDAVLLLSPGSPVQGEAPRAEDRLCTGSAARQVSTEVRTPLCSSTPVHVEPQIAEVHTCACPVVLQASAGVGTLFYAGVQQQCQPQSAEARLHVSPVYRQTASEAVVLLSPRRHAQGVPQAAGASPRSSMVARQVASEVALSADGRVAPRVALQAPVPVSHARGTCRTARGATVQGTSAHPARIVMEPQALGTRCPPRMAMGRGSQPQHSSVVPGDHCAKMSCQYAGGRSGAKLPATKPVSRRCAPNAWILPRRPSCGPETPSPPKTVVPSQLRPSPAASARARIAAAPRPSPSPSARPEPGSSTLLSYVQSMKKIAQSYPTVARSATEPCAISPVRKLGSPQASGLDAWLSDIDEKHAASGAASGVDPVSASGDPAPRPRPRPRPPPREEGEEPSPPAERSRSLLMRNSLPLAPAAVVGSRRTVMRPASSGRVSTTMPREPLSSERPVKPMS
mmetsp:Transcript_55967/g.142350  ORF Transcript_55967/g.142350 Transcript_55967/m.142350 type:complete len:656 (+) Transcript_55967:1827-3794(+)